MISNPAIHPNPLAAYAFGMAKKPDPRMPRIGQRKPPRLWLREWMTYKDLSGEEMAGRMECSPGTVSKLLSGAMAATPEWLARFAGALGPEVEVVDLYRDPERPTQQDLLRGLPDDEQARIVRAIRALTGTDD